MDIDFAQPSQPTLTIQVIRCQRCGYEWLPRKQNPIACPQCSSRSWNGSIEKPKADIYSHKCLRCSYEWTSPKETSKTCPRCRSRYWNEGKIIYPRKCLQCKYEWNSRYKNSAVCPACHSDEWDVAPPPKPGEPDYIDYDNIPLTLGPKPSKHIEPSPPSPEEEEWKPPFEIHFEEGKNEQAI